ncbi:MAG: YibE/F family protein [Candidatus Uhrbacteria bacterium]
MTTRLRSRFLFIALVMAFLAPSIVFAQPTSTTTSTAVTGPAPTDEVSGGTDGSSAPLNAPVRGEKGQYERATVQSVTLQGNSTDAGTRQVTIFRVRFLSGPLKDQEKDIQSDVGSNPYNLDPHQGDTVVVYMQADGQGGWLLYLDGYDRRVALLFLGLLFVLTMVFLSGWQGLKVVGSMIISVAMIGYVLIPLFLRGANPVPVAIILSGVFILISTASTTGFNKKALVTAVGTMGGALVAYLVGLIFADWANLSGLSTEDDRAFFNKNPNLNPRGLLFAGIIIAAAGVLEDVAVSIASSVSEVSRHHPRASFKDLFSSGMVVGKEHMGALANTLVFAYVGASLSSLLLYSQFDGSWLKFINFDSVVDEVVRSLAGTIGLVFTVPITALLAAWATVGPRAHKHE